MNKEKIIKRASEILDILENDKYLLECWTTVGTENFNAELTDEAWTYGLVAEYAFIAGMFETWKEYQVKFNQEILKGGK